MAHEQQKDFCLSVKAQFPELFQSPSVLDIGSLDINGNNRYLFDGNYKYVGVDIGPGKNVDAVCKGHEFESKEKFDIVISTECFEHDKFWKYTMINCAHLTKSGGMFIFSCATTGRAEHGTSRSHPFASPYSHLQFDEHYQNLTEEDVRFALNVDYIFSKYWFGVHEGSCDLYFYGIKK